jgi:hypothetical protein
MAFDPKGDSFRGRKPPLSLASRAKTVPGDDSRLGAGLSNLCENSDSNAEDPTYGTIVRGGDGMPCPDDFGIMF